MKEKPGTTIITVARKPVSESNTALNTLKWGTGGINVDRTRITAGADYAEGGHWGERFGNGAAMFMGTHQTRPWAEKLIEQGLPVGNSQPHANGRWPSNMLLSHLTECQQSAQVPVYEGGGSEVVLVWRCAPGCPVVDLDAQSGDASRFFKQFQEIEEG